MLRTERPGDMLPVYELVSAAFGRPDEAELVNRLRKKHEDGESSLTGADVQQLTDILSGKSSPEGRGEA